MRESNATRQKKVKNVEAQMVAFLLVLLTVSLSQIIYVPLSAQNPCETFLSLEQISLEGGSK